MKTLFLLLSAAVFACNTNTQTSTPTSTQEKEGYQVFSEEKFKEIETEYENRDIEQPIELEGYTKAELVSFYVQSYNDEQIKDWVDFAYDKMHNFQESDPTYEQEMSFREVLALPRTRENMHAFIMLMTKEQIEVVGY
ncbi:MAG: hypothetical protein AAF734_01175 [Bacteroidota bacterium]